MTFLLLYGPNMCKALPVKEGLQHRTADLTADLYPIEVGHCNTNNLDNKQVEDLMGSWKLTNKTINK